MSDEVYEFKYLVSWNPELKQHIAGYTRTWKFHIDIQASFPEGYRPRYAGYFRMTGDDVETIQTYGISEGYRLGPHPFGRDVKMLKLLMSDGQDLFDREGNPL